MYSSRVRLSAIMQDTELVKEDSLHAIVGHTHL